MTTAITTPKASASADPGPSDAVPRSVGRVLDAFEAVLAEGTCNLATVARATGLTPTTALRHLRALEARGYLVRDEAGTFSAGPTVLRIAASLHDDGPLERLVAVVQPHLDRLAAEGFVVFDGEWWHFEHGTRRWAAITGHPPRYGPASDQTT